MPDREYFDQLKTIYNTAPINAFFKPRLTIESQGVAKLAIDIDERFFHAANAIHGCVYFKLLDDAAFFAANSLDDQSLAVTVSFNINLFKPVTKGSIHAIGRVEHHSKRLIVAKAHAFDEDEQLIASGSGNFMPSQVNHSSRS